MRLFPYRKRPMSVFAGPFDPEDPGPVQGNPAEGWFLETGMGRVLVKEGMWIVQGESGDYYAVPGYDFKRIYEAIEKDEAGRPENKDIESPA